MKNLLITVVIVLLTIGCSKDMSIYDCKGIPDEDQSFTFMYFKSNEEGYLFGTFKYFQKMSEEELNNPDFIPQSATEANIYKTINGGRSWIKIDSIPHFTYHNIGVSDNEHVFILMGDSRENFKYNIVKFDIESEKLEVSNEIKTISSLWLNNENLFYTNNRGNIYLNKLNKNFGLVDSITIKNYVLFGVALKSYNHCIFNSGESTSFGYINRDDQREISIPIIPQELTKQTNTTVLIAGNNKNIDTTIDLISYDVDTQSSKIIKRFEGYSIVRNLQSNEKIIAGFIGNISGAFTKYDLFYSIDNGRTWQIRKLEESNYIRPNFLVDNIMYIYSGGARMQKIILDSSES